MVEVSIVYAAHHEADLVVDECKLNPVEVVRSLERIAVEHHHILFVKHFLRVDQLFDNILDVKPLVQLLKNEVGNGNHGFFTSKQRDPWLRPPTSRG